MEEEYRICRQNFLRGKDTFINLLNSYSVEELEELTNREWNDEADKIMYFMFMRERKRKLNEQFIFTQENINAIVDLDEKFKECCRQLKVDVENEFSRLFERKEANHNTFHFYVEGYVYCLKKFRRDNVF